MNFDLDEKYLAIQKEALQLAQSIENIAFEADASNEIHAGVLEAFRASSDRVEQRQGADLRRRGRDHLLRHPYRLVHYQRLPAVRSRDQ